MGGFVIMRPLLSVIPSHPVILRSEATEGSCRYAQDKLCEVIYLCKIKSSLEKMALKKNKDGRLLRAALL
jgi:hypothetical protein